jgi:glycosyl transferase family 1
MHDVDGAFAAGDYLSAARDLPPDTWQYWASRGLIGHPAHAADALGRFTNPEAAFFSGVASWIAGDDDRARGILSGCPGVHAERLVELISKRPITVLSQLPWNRRGAWDILTHLTDSAFRLLNVGFHPEDIPNRPYADVSTLLPNGVRPDFFVVEMLEWHLIPPNIRMLGCPVIGHSSDFDLHVQAVAPWLDMFDELVVLDHVEWRAMRGLTSVPVSVFPKVFGVPAQVPGVPDGERDIDVFLSGTVNHPYHADKSPVLLALLSLPGIRLEIVEGFEGTEAYYKDLGRAKATCTYVRHPGAMPTRALEALAMGCAVAVQEDSALRLFGGDAEGIVSYSPEADDAGRAVRQVLTHWNDFRDRARAGAAMVRREFALERVASQYFRFLTVLAARPRDQRAGPAPEQMLQKRPVVQRGWLPSTKFGKRMLMSWAAESVSRIERQLEVEESARRLNDLARERLLAHYHDPHSEQPQWLADVVAPLERAIGCSPTALVPRFNLARALLHFGGPHQVRKAIALLDATLRYPATHWQVDLLDDVLPWDFCSSWFDYRRYFDEVTRAMGSTNPMEHQLTPLILASMTHYRARYADEVPGSRSSLEWAMGAVRLDPGFAEYVLYCCRLLVSRGKQHDLDEAHRQLEQLARCSMRMLEILDIARYLPPNLRGDWFTDLEQRAATFWSATRVREDLPEPLLRPATDAGFRLRATASNDAAGEVL